MNGMKCSLLVALLGILGPLGSTSAADFQVQLKDAALALAAKPNYSWTAAFQIEGTSASGRAGQTLGKTERNGYTFFTSTLGDNRVEIVLNGDKGAINREGTWQTVEEIEKTDAAWLARRLRTFKPPAEDAAQMTEHLRNIKQEANGVYSGELNDEGVKELITRGRKRDGVVSKPKGAMKFWIAEGQLVKYQYTVEAVIAGDADPKEVEVRRSVVIEIKEVGATQVAVPEPVKKLI